MKKFLEEFKEFALKGNVMDLAVGVIIGAAFQSLVTSLTENIINPIIGMVGQEDMTSWKAVVMGCEIKYGAFITDVINFIIMAFIVFLIVKGMNSLRNIKKKPEVAADPTEKECPFCKSQIPIAATRCPHCTSQL
ncbi:MAG: large conductance mechanosensitive channel protein MscL [Lachnospiraceae bacterium]|nr:large conductance mechanosensitive channel protein MscL [Lachnospiraceae bacterium]